MISRHRAQSSSLFLLELIIAILFFSVASAVCVQLFVKSHNLNKDASELDFAINECSAVAEIISSCDSQSEINASIAEIYPAGLNFNKDYSPCDKEHSYYTITLDTEMNDSLLAAEIRVESDTDTVYQLNIKQNMQKEVQ